MFFWWHAWLRRTAPAEALDKQQIVVLLAAWLAVIGWITTAWTSIRNSVKQHTVNTLLQSRLSATYMERADRVNKFFGAYEAHHPLRTRDPDADPTQGIAGDDEEALRYILNYFEYIAIGVRHGDLHEAMLRASLRSILTKTTFYSRDWIERRVGGGPSLSPNPLLYRNLRWLYLRWRDVDGVPGNDLRAFSMVRS
ncbi:DUF4760 domain-containing protein [Pseudorhodoferax sp. Leaf274]|uniref:DUF4760 domain-containing protein n=1 Tax=Pseudorhodoferax sp. Leaf274 TaxID=1736318 RepID=UPI001F2B15B3|nr:DUF4760 domain-containing protein [Pseudorhodoferax sp. Leaf274]